MKIPLQLDLDDKDLKRENINCDDLLDNILGIVMAYCSRCHIRAGIGYNPEYITDGKRN